MTPKNFFPDPTQTALVVIDIQQKLAATMPPEELPGVLRYSAALLGLAQEFNLPIIITEQYPAGLGPTLPEIMEKAPGVSPIPKIAFSCLGEPAFTTALEKTSASQVILCGIECHVCVLQTAFDLLASGRQVFVAADAICSRTSLNYKTGLALMQEGGVVISSTEILLFQMLRQAGSDRFKRLSRLIR